MTQKRSNAWGGINVLPDPKDPKKHDFKPDPQTPTACVVCALHPAWHRDHQAKP